MTSVAADRRIDGSTVPGVALSRLFVSVGEPSGDAHAADVIREIARRNGALSIDAVGGPAVRAAGANVWHDSEGLGAMGLFEAARSLPGHLALLRRVRERLAAVRYDLVMVVDYPGLHMRVAGAAARVGSPVLYYVAPQLWAWAAWRAAALRQTVRHVAAILPFEEPFFRAQGLRCTFVGHPLLDRPVGPDRESARRRLGLGPRAAVLAVFPGARITERARHEALFAATVRALRRAVPELQTLVARPAGTVTTGFPDAVGVPAPLALAAADAALVKSGTATLEAALAGVPMVVAYRMHPLTFAIARRLVRVPHVSLVNLVAGREVVPERLQRAASPAALAEALLPLLDRDGAPSRAQRDAFAAVRARLGAPGVAGRVADLAQATARAG